ncbi:hypothetical protein HDU76_001146 [Blyttiomyces sp. JEL0837]|nr:hypothetical protein HDU76_001146 [Blyttiomyces sp. JEL0837]
MSSKQQEKTFDLLIYGATGFTGKYVCRDVTRIKCNLGRELKWAVAGRSKAKLEEIVQWIGIPDGFPKPSILVADVSDTEALNKAIASSRVVINCVGPFRYYGEPVVKACVENHSSYVDITGEPEFVENMFYKYHQQAIQNNVSIVPCCGFDSIPADLGTLYLKSEFQKRGYTASTVEMFIKLVTGKSGFRANFATYESAVMGIANANELRKLRKLVSRPALNTIGKKLQVKNGARYDKFVHSWVVPFLGADASVVRMGQQLSEALRLNSHYARAVHSIHPVQFAAYMKSQSLFYVAGMILFGSFMTFFSKYSWGRYLLLKFPGFFSFGVFSKKGPTDAMLRESGFISTFVGRGYKSLISPTGSQGINFDEQEVEIVTKVQGPEAGYVATPIAVVISAFKILEDRAKKTQDVPPGVLTPASAFGATDIISRLDAEGIKFSVVSTRDLTN